MKFTDDEAVPDRRTLPAAPRTDSWPKALSCCLVLAAVQRIVGFGRGVLVCRWLSPDELGQWDMAFGFLTLAAPLTVLGLPGSFGRYVEYFRQRGQLSIDATDRDCLQRADGARRRRNFHAAAAGFGIVFGQPG